MRFNVIGHITSEIGLGMMVCDLMQALIDLGHDVAGYDVDPGLNRKGRNLAMHKYLRKEGQLFKDGIDLVLFPISAVDHWGKAYHFGTRRVAFPLWELPDLNPRWLEPLRNFDLIVAPSQFIHETLTASGLACVYGPHPHYVGSVQADRAAFDLPADKVIFTFAFDPSSDLQRKNPMAIVKAFRLAAAPNALLNIQINSSADRKPEFDRWLQAISGQPNVRIMRDHLSHADEMKLLASSDVYISLHRAEGLGLGMLEAMQLGKPVIATDWSGNMSFMDANSAALVTHRLIPVQGNIPAYNADAVGKSTVWADPSRPEAAIWIKQLAADHNLRRDLGQRAQAKADQFQAAARECEWLNHIPEKAISHQPSAIGRLPAPGPRPRVLIFTPIIDGLMPEVEAAVKAQQADRDWILGRENPYPTPDNRNVTAQYLKAFELARAGGYDALLTVEHDIRIPAGAIERLMSTDADVVYGVYQFRTWPALNAWQYINNKNLGMPLGNYPHILQQAIDRQQMKVSGVGWGCTLIRRKVFEAITPRDDTGGSYACDIPFAEDCLRAGFEQVARFDVICSHWNGRQWLTPFEKENMKPYLVLETVNANANGKFMRLKKGASIELTDEQAADLMRVGYVQPIGHSPDPIIDTIKIASPAPVAAPIVAKPKSLKRATAKA